MTSRLSARHGLVSLDRVDATAVVRLDRPAARNALSLELLEDLRETLEHLGGDNDVAAVILTGTDPAFSAGLDLGQLGDDPGLFWGHDLLAWFDKLSVPTIAAVNGPAVTGGMEIALACDIRLASDRATFADTHARVGVMPGWGMSVHLPALVGSAAAVELSLTARTVDADEAAALGLVTRVVPHEHLLGEAHELAAAIATTNPTIRRRLYRLYREQSRDRFARAHAAEQRAAATNSAGLLEGHP